MFEYLLEQNHLGEEFKQYNLLVDDIVFIKELIDPKKLTYRSKLTDPTEAADDWPHKGRTVEKSYLYEVNYIYIVLTACWMHSSNRL